MRDVSKQMKHHEQTPTYQRSFLEKVQRLTSTLEEMGNPFQEETGDLLSLDTKDIASPGSAERIATHLLTGNASFEAHLQTLEHEDTSSFYAPIKKTKMDFFHKKSSTPLPRRRW